MKDGVALRFAISADIDALATFSAAAYAAAFGEHFRPDDLTAHLAANLSPDRWRDYLARERVLVAEEGDELVGFLQFGPTGDDKPEIYRLYVAPRRQQEGIGAALMRAVLADPQIAAAADVRLEVWEHNRAAIRFYERFGFAPTGERGLDFVTASGEVSPGDIVMVRPGIKDASTRRG